jgi:hypothetical protein
MVVGRDGPTEYKVVARGIRARGRAPLGLSLWNMAAPAARWTENADASRLALTRARFAA